ncbi:ABC transporter ATP-binding protein [Paucibacter sp. R3-3]|uniref:ABC transporter ATP-binding protein n=1 Tax=Roseateles agri TaxID=3098619 RepID=A0ABU5DBR6_9BURK|nr:ABC transporter ATP-binding protein [Paucibacter sp. R3-3]MDY0743721.1 ABC transporter ATP-binding protein [Paucibacter sp. R3-3]
MTTLLLDLHVRRKAYPGGRTVLTDIRLQLQAGEVVSLVGASGCGKSTLLRIAAGLDDIFEGHALLEGKPLGLRRVSRATVSAVGVVFQEPRLFPWLDVAANIGFDGSAEYDAKRVSALLDEVGLAGYERALPKQLSGGQAQRVAIARALYTGPRLLLLDEPFSALDAFTRVRLQDLVLELAQRHGASLLVVTHELEEAVLLSDRVLLLDEGHIARELTVPLARPRSRDDSALTRLRRELHGALKQAA